MKVVYLLILALNGGEGDEGRILVPYQTYDECVQAGYQWVIGPNATRDPLAMCLLVMEQAT